MKQARSKRTRVVLCLILSAILCPSVNARPSENGDFNKAMEGFRAFYADALKKHGIAGSSFMFIHNGRVAAKEFYGLANVGQSRKVDEETIYHWASVTKTFTGVAIMQLRDRGMLRLDDPIVKHIPELRGVHNPFGDMSEITIRHLMSHSAGFRGATWPWGGDKDWHPHEPLRWEQLVAMIPYTEILFKPGSRFSYSNPGIIFLGRVIELLTTDDYEVYVDKNILKPLEMYRSYFDNTPYHLARHKAQSYFLREGKLVPARPETNTGITVSNGGLNAPLGDMAKYINFLLGGPDKQSVYDQVLKRSSLEEMFQAQVSVGEAAAAPSGQGQGRKEAMGLTFFIEDNFGQHFIGHSGGQNAFISHFFIKPGTRTAYLVAYNTLADEAGKNTRVLDKEVKDYLFKNVFTLFDEKNQSGLPMSVRKNAE